MKFTKNCAHLFSKKHQDILQEKLNWKVKTVKQNFKSDV